MDYLSAAQIQHLHERVVAASGGLPGTRDSVLLEAIPTRVRLCQSGREFYRDLFHQAAMLFHTLITGKPFHDGNKRTALASTFVFLAMNGEDLAADNHELVDFCRAIERGSLDVPTIADWIRRRTVSVAPPAEQ